MKNQTKISGLLSLSLVAFALVFTFASCDKDDDKDKNSLNFDRNKVEVLVGKSDTVTVSGGTAPYVVTSSDAKIATVKVEKNKIAITGVKNGSVTIAVKDKNANTGKIAVTVKDADAKGLDFDKKKVEINAGKEDVVTIKNGTAPYAVAVKDETVATATIKDNKVTIKGLKAGKTTVTVTDKDKKNEGSISVEIK